MTEPFSRLDHDRVARQGFPEVVFASGKTPDQVAHIVAEFTARSGRALATRATDAHASAVIARVKDARYDPLSRLIRVGALAAPTAMANYSVTVACAGTSDLPVSEECAQTLEWAGITVKRFNDIGVANLDRLLAVEADIRSTDVCIVIAGMEGALPSVIGGRLSIPVIAVPTSVGYGANFGGISALLGMLTSCVPGVSVVNIDNGFGAAACANRMLRGLVAAASTQ